MSKKVVEWNVKDIDRLKSLYDISVKNGEDFRKEIKALKARLDSRFCYVLNLISKTIKKKVRSKKIYMPWESLGWSFFEDKDEDFGLTISLYGNFGGDEVPDVSLYLVIHGSDEEIVGFVEKEMGEIEVERNIKAVIRGKLTEQEIEFLGLD
jgi:hypothetical protein